MSMRLLIGAALAIICLSEAKAASLDQFKSSIGISSDAFKSIVDDFQKVKNNPVVQDPQIVLPPSDALVDPRIVGGIVTTVDKYPWQVALIFQALPEPYRSLRCGGSVVGQHWILTAAHCVDDGTAQDVVSQTTFYKYLGTRLSTDNIFVHPSWKRATLENDIALIKIKGELSTGSIVKVSHDTSDVASGTDVYVTGWGAIFEGGPTSDVLRVANMPIVGREVCQEAYGNRFKESMICAGLRDGGLDSCQGDSGGPAVSFLNGSPILVGVVSWGDGCAQRKKYGVYTKVGLFASWIQQTIAANGG